MVNIQRVQQEFRHLWSSHAPLTATAVIMLAAFVGSIAGLLIDPRVITGSPAWLKPAKFAISTAIYSGSIAWLLRYVTVWPRFTRAMGWIVAVVLNLEVALIDIQAARGTTSHFNVATPLDMALFAVMGTAIAVLWLASAGILVALFRQQFGDAAWGWALRLSLLISLLGAATGGMMLRPSRQQLEAPRPTVAGGHTVGAPDGGPGLPGVGWSAQHGDLRIPHFFGLHALQVIPFLAWFLRRRRGFSVTAVCAAAASYFALTAILTWQALRGEPIAAPQSATVVALSLWLAATLAAFAPLFARLSRREQVAR